MYPCVNKLTTIYNIEPVTEEQSCVGVILLESINTHAIDVRFVRVGDKCI